MKELLVRPKTACDCRYLDGWDYAFSFVCQDRQVSFDKLNQSD